MDDGTRGLLQSEERALEVDVHNPVQFLFRHVGEGSFDVLYTRVSDDSIDRPEALFGCREQGLNAGASPSVSFHDKAFVSLVGDCGTRFFGRRVVGRVAEDEVISEGRQMLGNRPADPFRAASNDNGIVLTTHGD
jgi:hypothetical protein